MDGNDDFGDKEVKPTVQLSPELLNELFSSPGKVGEAPGKVGEAPGKVGEAPGKVAEAPDKKDETPGKVDEAPGKIPGDAPGKIPGDAPGKIPGDAPGKVGDNPGKVGEGGGSEILDQLTRTELLRASKDAFRTGKLDDLQNSIKNAFEKCNGDGSKFQKFGEELAEQMKKEGITVKVGKNSMSVHREGSPYGVEFKADANLDFKTGKVKADVSAQAYDWVSKKDVNVKAEDVIKDINKKDTTDGGKVRDGKELGKSFDDAYDNKDFSKVNADLAASVKRAYEAGGMDAVRQLEKQANDAAETPGGGPVVLEENGKLKIYNAKAMSRDAAALAADMTQEQLTKAGIINHPKYGFLKVIEAGPPPIEMKKPTTVPTMKFKK